MSLSMGVVAYDPEKPVSIETLLARADNLMYEEKQGKKKNSHLNFKPRQEKIEKDINCYKRH